MDRIQVHARTNEYKRRSMFFSLQWPPTTWWDLVNPQNLWRLSASLASSDMSSGEIYVICIFGTRLVSGPYSKHCQRHNGPEGWVHITSYYTNLDQTISEFWLCKDKSWEDRTEHANTKRRKEDWMPKRQESVNLSYVKVEPARRNASWRQFWFQIED